MTDARLGWCALLTVVCMQACGGGDDAEQQGPVQGGSASGGSGGGSGVSGGSGGGAGTTMSMVDGGGTGGTEPSGSGGAGGTGGAEPIDAGGSDGGVVTCVPREVSGTPEMHFHHVHFNSADPEEDLSFFDRFFGAPAVTFCSDASGAALTRATRTERGWFLYTKVDEAPDPTLNAYLEHIGWVSQMPVEELERMIGLGVKLFPEGRAQCAQAASGMAPCPVPGLAEFYYYYVQAPSGARVEVALGPGPATSGFGHVHFIMGDDLTFFETVSDGAYASSAIDDVNHINAALAETLLENETVVDSRGKPIDHIAYSTTDLEGAKARIEAAGIAIAEDISLKPEYGFRSFFVRTPKGTWLELVEDSRFE